KPGPTLRARKNSAGFASTTRSRKTWVRGPFGSPCRRCARDHRDLGEARVRSDAGRTLERRFQTPSGGAESSPNASEEGHSATMAEAQNRPPANARSPGEPGQSPRTRGGSAASTRLVRESSRGLDGACVLCPSQNPKHPLAPAKE